MTVKLTIPLQVVQPARVCCDFSLQPTLRRDRSAIAALEFALVAPILLLMMIGMICLGLYFTYIHEVQELASGAARASVSGLSGLERDSLARQFVATAVSNSGFLASTDLSVSTATSGTPATNYAVTVGYDLKNTPVPMLASMISLPASKIVRTSTVQFGNY